MVLAQIKEHVMIQLEHVFALLDLKEIFAKVNVLPCLYVLHYDLFIE